ncbi:MAG: succinate dehydrogenase [Firmicutes bacterium]|nr:succinate dehydrogenase [Bacillota bacterium]
MAGVIPVGIFLLLHLTINASAIDGAAAYNATIQKMETLPALIALEWVLIYIPLYFHAIYGIIVTLDARNNFLRYTYTRNWLFYLQRVTAYITLVFVTYHIWALRIAKALGLREVSFATMVQEVHNPWMLAFYVIGVIAAVYHFTNGLFTFGITWGVTVGPRAQRVAGYIWGVLFLAMSAAGVGALVSFR